MNLGAITSSAALSFITTSGNITLTDNINTNNNALTLQSAGAINRTGGTLITGTGQISLESVGISTVSVNTTANMIATVGALSAIGLQTLNLANIISQGPVSLSTTFGDVVLNGNLTTTNSSLSMNAAGGISGLGTITLGSGSMLLQAGSDISIRALTSGNISTFGSAVGGNLNVTSTQDLNFGRVTVSGAINISTDLNMALYGLMSGSNISLSSVLEFRQKFVGLALQTTSGNLNLTAGQVLSDDAGLQVQVNGEFILNSSGEIDLNAFGNLNLSSTSALTLGKITSSGSITIQSTASVDVVTDNLITTPSDILFNVVGDIGISNPLMLNVNGTVKIENARSVNIESGYLLSIDSIQSSGNVSVETILGATMKLGGSIQSTSGTISLQSAGGLEIGIGAPISAFGNVSLASQQALVLPGAITAGIGGSGTLTISSITGGIQAASSLISYGNIICSGVGDMQLPSSVVSNGGNFLIQMQGGNFNFNNSLVSLGSGRIGITSQGSTQSVTLLGTIQYSGTGGITVVTDKDYISRSNYLFLSSNSVMSQAQLGPFTVVLTSGSGDVRYYPPVPKVAPPSPPPPPPPTPIPIPVPTPTPVQDISVILASLKATQAQPAAAETVTGNSSVMNPLKSPDAVLPDAPIFQDPSAAIDSLSNKSMMYTPTNMSSSGSSLDDLTKLQIPVLRYRAPEVSLGMFNVNYSNTPFSLVLPTPQEQARRSSFVETTAGIEIQSSFMSRYQEASQSVIAPKQLATPFGVDTKIAPPQQVVRQDDKGRRVLKTVTYDEPQRQLDEHEEIESSHEQAKPKGDGKTFDMNPGYMTKGRLIQTPAKATKNLSGKYAVKKNTEEDEEDNEDEGVTIPHSQSVSDLKSTSASTLSTSTGSVSGNAVATMRQRCRDARNAQAAKANLELDD